MGYFWFSLANPDGTRWAGTEQMLYPSPSKPDYPADAYATVNDTADGVAIRQQGTRDPRRRAWVWQGYPHWHERYKDLWPLIEALHSTRRFQEGRSPFVYLKEDVSGEFVKWVTQEFTPSAATTTTLTTSGLTADALAGGVVEVLSGTGAGQLRPIQTNTATEITLAAPFATVPTGAPVIARWKEPQWFRVRVLQTPRTIDDGTSITRYAESRMEFVVDDPAWNHLG